MHQKLHKLHSKNFASQNTSGGGVGWIIHLVLYHDMSHLSLFRLYIIDDWNIGLRRCQEKMSSLGGPT